MIGWGEDYGRSIWKRSHSGNRFGGYLICINNLNKFYLKVNCKPFMGWPSICRSTSINFVQLLSKQAFICNFTST